MKLNIGHYAGCFISIFSAQCDNTSVTLWWTVWNTVDHFSPLKPQRFIKRQNVVLIPLQVPQSEEEGKKEIRGKLLKLKLSCMCQDSTCENWPDDLFSCCCDEKAVLSPNNIYILPRLAAQLNLSQDINNGFSNHLKPTFVHSCIFTLKTIFFNLPHPMSRPVDTFINSCAPPSGPSMYCDSMRDSVITARASFLSR